MKLFYKIFAAIVILHGLTDVLGVGIHFVYIDILGNSTEVFSGPYLNFFGLKIDCTTTFGKFFFLVLGMVFMFVGVRMFRKK